jgi:hypothetical protein
MARSPTPELYRRASESESSEMKSLATMSAAIMRASLPAASPETLAFSLAPVLAVFINIKLHLSIVSARVPIEEPPS